MQAETQLDNYTIIKDHRHKTSSVWKYFGDLNMNGELVDEKHVYCTKCFEESRMKKYQKSTSTGNLSKHLKRAHNVAEHPSYRVKHEKDRMVVTKEESINNNDDPDDGEAEFYIENLPNFIPMSSTSQQTISESDNNEYLVHDINELLIQEISKRPQIYDPSLCTKNKAQVRRQLWTEIYNSLNHLIEFEKLPKIWKNIRDRYQKIKKDAERGTSSATGKPKYRYYNQLRFLDDVEAHEMIVEDDNKLNVPIDNFVSNFIFMEDEPQVDQPDHTDSQPKNENNLHQTHDHETDDLIEDEDDDDEEEEEEEEDEEEMQEEEEQEYEEPLSEVTMHVAVKDEMFGNDEPQPKKVKLEISHDDEELEDDEGDDPDNSPDTIDSSSETQQTHLLQNTTHHRELMTPDNIASLLVEQHQHDILCHQHSNMSVASTITSSPSNSPHIPATVTTWQISPHLTATISRANANSALQSHIQQLPVVSMVTATVNNTNNHNNNNSSANTHHHLESSLAQSTVEQSTPQLLTVHQTATPQQQQQQQQDSQMLVTSTVTTTPTAAASKGAGSEFTIFGSYVAEVMRQMDKQKARMLQMKVMQLIAEYDSGADQ